MTRRRIKPLSGLRFSFAFCLFSVFFLPGLLSAQETGIPRVTTNGVERQGSGQLTFSWTRTPEFTEVREGRTLTLKFSDAAVFLLDRAAAQLPSYVDSISQTGVSTVVIRLRENFTTRTARQGNNVIVNILRESALATEAPPEELGENIGESVRVFRVSPDRLQPRPTVPSNVEIRVGIHSGYDRLVIPWPVTTAYSYSVSGRQLLIEFDNRFSTDLAKLGQTLRTRLSQEPRQSADGRTLELNFLSDINVRDFSYSNLFVIDLIRTSDLVAKATPTGEEEARGLNVLVRSGSHPDYTRIVFDYSEPTNYILEHENGELQLTFNRPNSLNLRGISFRPDSPFQSPRVTQLENSTRFLLFVPDDFTVRHFQSGTHIVVDILQAVEKDEFYPISPIKVTPGQFQREIFPLSAPNLGFNIERITRPAVLHQIDLDLPEAIGLAIFQRGDTHWIVIDRNDVEPIDINAILTEAGDLFGDAEIIPHPDATVLRLLANQQLYSSVLQRGLTWEIKFHPASIPPLLPVDVHVVRDNLLQTTLSFLARNTGRQVTIADPVFQDEIIVGTLQNPGQGVFRGRNYPEFNILASTQGIALLPFSDTLVLSPSNSGFLLQQAGGINASEFPIDQTYEERGYRASGAPLLQFSAWSRDNEAYLVNRRRLNDLLLNADRGASYDNLLIITAGYHLSQGLASDTLGLLNLYQARNPLALNSLSFKLHKAAALLLLNRVDEAIGFLNDPEFSRFEESVLWQGVAAALKGRWLLADSYFKQSDSFLDRYPVELRNRLGLLRIEASLQSQEAVNAGLWIQRLEESRGLMSRSQRAALSFLAAWRHVILGDVDSAIALWENLAKSKDPFWGTKAELSLTLQKLKDNEIDTQQASNILEHLRYQWQGDELELSVRDSLIDIYFTSGLYEKGFDLARSTVSDFSETRQAAILSQIMLDTFADLFINNQARNISSLQAYRIYNKFNELTPPGAEGNKLLENVADRMILDNLYETAASLLTDRLNQRTQGEEKKRIAIKTALLYIADEKPEDALAILEVSEASLDETSPLAPDARQLQAKALADSGNVPEALSLIAGDISSSADLLRRDIYWENQDWQQASQVMQRLVGPVPREEDARFDHSRASLLVSWAIALQLANETESLRALQETYGFVLEDSPLEEVFSFITAEPDPRAPTPNLEQIIAQSTDEGQFTFFLDNYRGRYFPAPLVSFVTSAEEGAPADDAPADETPDDSTASAIIRPDRVKILPPAPGHTS